MKLFIILHNTKVGFMNFSSLEEMFEFIESKWDKSRRFPDEVEIDRMESDDLEYKDLNLDPNEKYYYLRIKNTCDDY